MGILKGAFKFLKWKACVIDFACNFFYFILLQNKFSLFFSKCNIVIHPFSMYSSFEQMYDTHDIFLLIVEPKWTKTESYITKTTIKQITLISKA